MMQSTANQSIHTPESGSYEEAIKTLNGLTSLAAEIEIASKCFATENLVENTPQYTKKYLIRSGLTLEQLNTLSIIHVTGTKGKGSTCAFVEAILRQHGFRTGLFASPHLISVRERFRINEQSLSELEFTREFWPVYRLLEEGKQHEHDMPRYYVFLTILMFHIFLKANIDVLILEVGIGGEYDYTNIVESTVCTAITSIDLDHTDMLGKTLETIAWQKAGIFRAGAPAFTVPLIPDGPMKVLQARAQEKGCSLTVVPNIAKYPWNDGVPILGIRSIVQSQNASLAIQLSSAWMANRNRIRPSNTLGNTESKQMIDKHDESAKRRNLNFEKVAMALRSCKLPGRTQILLGKSLDFYVDVAHTFESINSCVSWFRDIVQNDRKARSRYLIFNTSGDRDSAKLMEPLKELGFDKAYFAPNVAGDQRLVDRERFNICVDQQLEKCRKHADMWGENSVLANTVSEALQLIKQDHHSSSKNNDTCKPQVLVTGSFYLVGALLSVIDPQLTMSTDF